jgi:hypothetical protein
MRWCALLVLVAACGAEGNVSPTTDGHPTGDAGAPDAGCNTILVFDPPMPVADPVTTIRAQAQVFGAVGVPSYTWSIEHDSTPVDFTTAAPDGSQIDFIAPTSGTYYVRVVIGGGTSCGDGYAPLDVAQMGAQHTNYRLRVLPPAGAGAPPQEWTIQVAGGADFTHDIFLDPGVPVTGSVKNGATGVAAYLRFMPSSSPKGYVETFSDGSGAFATRLLGQNHQVLVVPMTPGLAPALVPWDLTTQTLTVGAGNAVTGTVKDGAGNPLAGAQVQITEHTTGVPSTLATTASDGTFTLRASFAASATVDVKVTPPAGRGLPALAATGAFGASIAIQYANAPTCNVGATPVQRAGSPQANAQVTVVGTIANAGTIGGAAATGTARIGATTDGTGHLPGTLVPRAALSAVVDLGSGDLAVASLDTSTCGAQTISAPAMAAATGTAQTAGGNPLAYARIEAVPAGALALAGAPRIEATTDGSGAFSLAMASGGRYDVTFSDPRGHSAPLLIADANAAAIPATPMLGKAITVRGKVSVTGNANPIIGASIQALCFACGPATPPISEAASTETSTYSLGIPDPGTM